MEEKTVELEDWRKSPLKLKNVGKNRKIQIFVKNPIKFEKCQKES